MKLWEEKPVVDIFVVDDDEDLCEVMTWALRKEGYSVLAYTSGAEALAALRTQRPRFLVVDYHLGDMDGSDFLRRRSDIQSREPVILISGSPDEVRGLVSSGEYAALVEKPLDLSGLLHEVQKLSELYSPRSSTGASRPPSRGPASAE